MLDTGFDLDFDAVRENIDEAEVVTLYFPLLRKTLLVDTRSNDVDGPMVRLVPMADSSHERFESLQRLRPRFPRPESITMIPWGRRVASLQSAGIWDGLIDRLTRTGNHAAVVSAEDGLRSLLRLEARELGDAIRGEHYQTLWASTQTGLA